MNGCQFEDCPLCIPIRQAYYSIAVEKAKLEAQKRLAKQKRQEQLQKIHKGFEDNAEFGTAY